jgi:hypothetical protein
VEQAGVASVVFFTARFQADVRAWLAEITTTGGWAGGCAAWLGSALQPHSPYNTPGAAPRAGCGTSPGTRARRRGRSSREYEAARQHLE